MHLLLLLQYEEEKYWSAAVAGNAVISDFGTPCIVFFPLQRMKGRRVTRSPAKAGGNDRVRLSYYRSLLNTNALNSPRQRRRTDSGADSSTVSNEIRDWDQDETIRRLRHARIVRAIIRWIHCAQGGNISLQKNSAWWGNWAPKLQICASGLLKNIWKKNFVA